MKRSVVLFCTCLATVWHAVAQTMSHVPGEALVRFNSSVTAGLTFSQGNQVLKASNPKVDDLLRKLQVSKAVPLHPYDIQKGARFAGFDREYVLHFPPSTDIEQALGVLRQEEVIEAASPNWIHAVQEVPNDPRYSEQWGLAKIGMPSAWNITHGSPTVKVAVLDVGFKLDHADLVSGLSTMYRKDETDILMSRYPNPPYQLVEGEDYESPDDDPSGTHNHGTHVAGIIAATTNNGVMVSSVGWSSEVIPVRCGFKILKNGEPQGLFESDDWIRALDWVRLNSPAKVVNMSFGRPYSSGPDLFEEEAVAAAVYSGIIICAAAGNYWQGNPKNPYLDSVAYPAAYPDVIAVGATTSDDYRCGFSCTGSLLSLTAPGSGVLSTAFTESLVDTCLYMSGTSMASPHVCAASALLLALNPTFNPAEVKARLESSAFNVPGMNGEDFTIWFGNGRLDVHKLLLNAVCELAAGNKSTIPFPTAGNSQRRIFRESSGTVHEIFGSGGEIFYRRSTDDGTSWHITMQLSNGLSGNVLPCLSFAGTTAGCVWARPGDDDRLDLVCARSTDGGITWPAASIIESGFHGIDSSVIPSLSFAPGGSGIVLYRTSGSLRYKLTSNFGASWGSAATIPGSTASCNMPSSGINTTYWGTKQANVAYATDVPENSPRIHYNYYDYQTSSWGSTMDLCSVLPSNYVHHARPSLAVSASEMYKTVHVAWDAEDTQMSGTRVLIHREGSFRYFPSVYSVLHYQAESKPSITGVSGEAAWMVYQSASGTSVWKRYYDGTYWAGGYGTWVANGRDPQISIGSSTAKYIWTDGSASPYEIKVSTEGLSKAAHELAYSRALNVIDSARGVSLSLEVGTPVLLYRDGRREEIPFAESLADSFLTDIDGLMRMGESSPFAVPLDAESLFVAIRISGTGQGALLSDGAGHIAVNVVDMTTGSVLKALTNVMVTALALRTEATLSVPIKDLGAAGEHSHVQIRPGLSGIETGAGTILSLGHMYRKAEGAGVAKGGEIAKAQPAIPTRFLLHQNYPNPFNPSTRFSFDIAEGGDVLLTIHDVLGREVGKVVAGHREPGRYTVEWSAGSGTTTLSSGLYLARLQVKGAMGRTLYSQATKIILVR